MDRRKFFAISTALGLLEARADADDLYEEYIKSTSKNPFVAFLGRKGVPGHAFVGVGVDLEAGLRVYERFFGLYPAEGGKLSSLKMIFGKTSGRLDYKWTDVSWDTQYIVRVNEEQRSRVIAKFAEWLSSAPDYSLVGNGGKNCNILAGDVAGSVGLKVPPGGGSTLPWNYIDLIKRMNSP